MPKPPNDYQKLKAIWYKKLKESGYQDIEDDREQLKAWSSRFANKRTMELWEEKQPYYYMARQLLNDYKFESNFERTVWEYYSEGLSVRKITTVLKKAKIKTNRTTIWLIVKRLEESMKKMYLAGYEGRDE